MLLERNRLEKPILGYVVIAAALIAGMLTATAFGQKPSRHRGDHPQADQRFLPPAGQHHASRRWILGVRADATDTGYLVRHIESHSAAREIGLEPGDRLIAINGQQVGRIGHRHVLLSETLERQGGHAGRVRLLIQNRRNQRLISLSVQLRHPAQHLGH